MPPFSNNLSRGMLRAIFGVPRVFAACLPLPSLYHFLYRKKIAKGVGGKKGTGEKKHRTLSELPVNRLYEKVVDTEIDQILRANDPAGLYAYCLNCNYQ